MPLKNIPLNDEGFLINAEDWSLAVAYALAEQENIQLTADHLEILSAIQQFYSDFDHSPSMRPLVKYIKQQLGNGKGNSIYLLTLFPESPAKFACKIAGIPKPEKCL